MNEGPVFETLRRVCGKLDAIGVPYAVVGGMALVAHGYNRTTVDVDILVNKQGLKAIHESLEGLGYVAPFAGSKNLRDTTTNVRIEFLISGGFPGDGKPKPVSFPEPADAGVVIDGISYLKLERLVELKLASGLSNPLRAKDIGDVIELVGVLALTEDFASRIDPSVQTRFLEIVRGLREQPRE